MRIQGPSGNEVGVGVGGPTQRAAGEQTTTATSAAPAVTNVSVASSTQAISQRQATSQSARAEKVASLKQAVASGSYRVDKQALSERMADEEMARAGAY